MKLFNIARALAQTVPTRRSSLIEGLERRALMSTTVIDHGVVLGHVDDVVPAGGYKIVTIVPQRGHAASSGAPGFQITLDFTGGLTDSQMAVFTAAAARWQSILTGDIPDVPANQNQYGVPIDDVRIEASGVAIDGVGGILGQAGPTYLRSGSYLPITGQMQFDTADLANIQASGLLNAVITHEMGHVLGIGTIWDDLNLLTGTDGSDPRFLGPKATAEYNALTGLNAPGVPVANSGGAGTIDSHWRETGAGGTALGNELMTGVINSAQANPLSRITAASMADLGYPLVNFDATDLYTVPTNPANGGGGDFTPVNPLPVLGALTASNSSPTPNSSFTLNLGSASDNGSVSTITFYRESNGVSGLQATGTDAFDTTVATVSGGTLSTTVSTAGLPVGNYTFYARAADNLGALSDVASVTVSVSTVPVPSTPTLAVGNDTGDSSTDGLTRLKVLTFIGTGPANSTITLKNGATTIGTGSSDGSGNYTVTTSTLADGTYAVTATASNAAGTSATSAARTVVIDSVAPVVVSATYDREVSQAITLTLGEALANRLTASSVILTNTTTSTTIPISIVVNAAHTIATFKSSSLLPNGNYVLTLPAGNLTDAAGNPLATTFTFSFRQLNGDANNDGSVSFPDLVILAQNFGQLGKTVSGGNLDYDPDGSIDFGDLVVLAQNYGITLPSAIVGSITAGGGGSGASDNAKSKSGGRVATGVLA